MKLIFRPAVRLMLRLPNEKKLPVMLAIFYLPLALLYFGTGGQLSPGAKAWLAGGVLLGIYAMVAFYLQANEGWMRVLGPFRKLADGDLTGKIDATGLGGHFGLFVRLLGEINCNLGELRQRAERELEARSRMVEELAAVNRTAQAALAENEQITVKLRDTQSELFATARQAGRAEIATNVLHNVGNVLNSVNVSASVIGGTLRKSRLGGLARALALLRERTGDIGEYLTRDEKGRMLPGYLAAVGEALAQEHKGMAEELDRLTKSLDHIKDVVATQQSHAMGGHVVEPVRPADLVEDALRMQSTALSRHHVSVVREFDAMPVVPLDRGRVLQILVNLISNAKAAMGGLAQDARRLTLRIDMASPSRLRFSVIDVGEGIPPENLTRIFVHGFTTRADGHGFGLHGSALTAQELGGTLTAASDGPGQGATFTLELPIGEPRPA